MRITVVGQGNVGGGLARLWQRAGHTVTALGSAGGDASDADVLVVAVLSTAITDALSKVRGIEGKVAIDATNALHGRNERFASLAHGSRRWSVVPRQSRSTSTLRCSTTKSAPSEPGRATSTPPRMLPAR